MPELPEVETVKNGIQPHLINQAIQSVTIRNKQLRWPIPDHLSNTLDGQTLNNIRRRSKYLLLDFNHGSVIIHLGMSGKLTIVNQKNTPKKHDHVDIVFDNGSILRYNDPRRFGAILWSTAPEQHPRLANLGPEPLSRQFTAQHLYKHCQGKSAAIKTIIMNAKLVVGVGNIYANEALFRSHIRPITAAKTLNLAQAQQLVKTIKSTLRQAIKAGGTTLKDFTQADGNPGYFQQKLWVYGRDGEPCQNCQTTIQRITQNQRSSFFCPTCQD